jgi:thiol:disulfide interchange protein DsbA
MPVLAEANKMKEQQTYWSEKKVLTGVPMLLVNGKYKVKFDGLDQNNVEQDLIALLAYLSAKK